ncbi:MAG: hypothetical protein L3J96_03685, partial [Thermoplasmata archaeon]|nr:hypothetical protein [Thermoplasmata archaeon]
MVAEVLTRWNGVFLVENGKVVRTIPIAQDVETLLERLRSRRLGQTLPEEARLLSESKAFPRISRDRRLVSEGVTL